jgi:flagellar motor switch protein FliN/FliY
MSEILSQDQIDSLLGKTLAGDTGIGAEVPASGSGSGGARDYAILSKGFDVFNEQASTVISTVLNKDVSFAVSQCEKADKATLQKKPASEVILVSAPFKSGLLGTLYCIIGKRTVAMLSDLMMMGDGSAEFSEDHKDAIAELFSQVMGSFTMALGDKFGESVSQGTVTAAACDWTTLPFSIDESDMCVLSLSIGGSTVDELVFAVPGELSEQLIGKLSHVQGGSLDSDKSSGLNSSELEDLSQITSSSTDLDNSFMEMPLSGETMRSSAPRENVDMLLDVELDVSIELGRTNLSIKRILEMGPGSIVELDRMAGEPVDLLVNNKVVAKGEVVVVDENFGIRIVSLVSAEERIKSLR